MPVLAGTLVAASYGCEQNKAIIQQELSMDMLLPSLRSCKNNMSSNHAISTQNGPSADDSPESNQTGSERKVQEKLNRNYLKNTRVLSQRGGFVAGNIRTLKARNQRESKVAKLSEEVHPQSASETSTLMLHCRFPVSFIDKAEQFFAAEVNSSNSELIWFSTLFIGLKEAHNSTLFHNKKVCVFESKKCVIKLLACKF